MKQKIELNVEPRNGGRAEARNLRLRKMIPAIIYGASENANLAIAENDVIKYNSRAYENALITLKSKDSKVNGKVALFKDVVVQPLTRRPEHVDLFVIDMNKAIRVSVEVRVEGKAIGIAEGGLLNITLRQVEVECLPTAIPDFITVDVTNLGIGDSVHVSDLKVAQGVKMISRPELTIAAVVIQEEEAAAPVAAAATPDAAAAPAAAAGAKPAAGAAAPAAAKPAAKK